MQYIFDPFSKAVTIIDGLDVAILPGPFKNRQEAIRLAKEHTSEAATKNSTGKSDRD